MVDSAQAAFAETPEMGMFAPEGVGGDEGILG